MEIARAERDEAARWLAIYDAQTAGRTAGDQHSSHSGIPSEMSEVLARALAAQPGNSTVQRIVGLALNHPVVCSDWWGKIGEAELEKAGVPYDTWDFALMKEMASEVRIAKSE